MTIKDSSESGFETDVVTASHDRGVVVDFWAPWCGPCHQLSPILERVAARYGDDVDLVKVNVDQAPALAARYRVRGIPAVKAFRGGKPVAEFTGVQPEAAVERLFAAVVPTETDRLVQQAREAPPADRERLLRAAVEAEPDHRAAVLELARLLAADDAREEALGLLARFPTDDEARRLSAELQLGAAAADGENLDRLREAAAAGDGAARIRLGKALLAAGEHEEGLSVLLEALGDDDAREEAHKAVLAAFAVLGDDHPLVRAYRAKLATALF